MKKFLSLAVLLVTALVGFTACNNDDESDATKSLAKTTFTATQHVEDHVKTGDITYTVSFNDDAQCVMRVESRNMKLLGIDKLYSDDTYYGGTYTMDGGTITFHVDCITTESAAHPYSVIDHPEAHTFTYNPDTKVLTTDRGVELNSTKFSRLECKKYAASNAEGTLTFNDLVGFWGGPQFLVNNGKNYVDAILFVESNGSGWLYVATTDLRGNYQSLDYAEGAVTIKDNSISVDGWKISFKSYGDGVLNGVTITDPHGKTYTQLSTFPKGQEA